MLIILLINDNGGNKPPYDNGCMLKTPLLDDTCNYETVAMIKAELIWEIK